MRYLLFLVPVAGLIAGCGTSSSSPAPTATSAPTQVVEKQLGARFSQPPAMSINLKHRYTASVETNRGNFTIQLLPRVAPVTVNNFVFLARHHYYDRNPFFRIIQSFMVQTGDPTGTGMGGPGYQFNDEKVTLPYSPGTVAMANAGKNTNGSQFFIVTGTNSSLPPHYTIFGRVIKGMNVVYKIAATPVTQNATGTELSTPLTNVYMKRVTIYENR